MSKITEYLKQILSARYGRDVRQAIHDGIQQCYYDGKAGGVDLEARQDIEKIESDTAEVKQDIESLEENLANYISQDDVVDDLTSTETQKPLSANQGNVLNGMVQQSLQYRGEIPSDADYETLDNGVWHESVGNDTYGIPQYSMLYKPINTSLSGSFVVCFLKTVNCGIYTLNKTANKYEKLALSSEVSPIKTITATSNTSGIVIVGTNETPLSVICDTGGYYVGRLFKTTDGFWFATIFDVSTAQPVTSEIEVTLVATMKP